MKLRRRTSLALLLASFAASVALRWPNLGRPLDGAHEDITAMILITLESWQAHGAVANGFRILQSYPLEADKFVYNRGMRLLGPDGNGYYASAPPLSVLAPYVVFAILGAEPTVLNIEIWNLALHLLTALLIYAIISVSFESSPHREAAALAGALVMTWMASCLWYFSNVYSWDTFWHVSWIAGTLVLLLIERRIESGAAIHAHLLLLFLTVFSSMCSDINGGLLPLTAVAYAIMRLRRRRGFWPVVLISCASALMAVSIMMLQYATVNGLGEYVRHLGKKTTSWSLSPAWSDVNQILHHYWYGYGALIAAYALYLLGIVASRGVFPVLRRIDHRQRGLLFLAAFPVVVHHAALLHWSAIHAYSVLKSGVLLAVVGALFIHLAAAGARTGRLLKASAMAAALVVLVASALEYELHFAKTPAGRSYEDFGNEVRSTAAPDEVVFAITSADLWPSAFYYAKRNIATVDDLDAARTFLMERRRNKGIVFFVDSSRHITRTERITI